MMNFKLVQERIRLKYIQKSFIRSLHRFESDFD